jgi:hypothetical protein
MLARFMSVIAVAVPVAVAPAIGRVPGLQSVNPSSTQNYLYGVSAVSASDAWAVGYYVDNGTNTDHTLILHWNGTAWSRVKAPQPGHGVRAGQQPARGRERGLGHRCVGRRLQR